MEFSLDRRHEEVRRNVRRFVEARVAPQADAWDRDRAFPGAAWKALAAQGLAGLPFPEKYGGAGADI